MGEVWHANATGTDRIVAIKLLHALFLNNEEFKRYAAVVDHGLQLSTRAISRPSLSDT